MVSHGVSISESCLSHIEMAKTKASLQDDEGEGANAPRAAIQEVDRLKGGLFCLRVLLLYLMSLEVDFCWKEIAQIVTCQLDVWGKGLRKQCSIFWMRRVEMISTLRCTYTPVVLLKNP